MPMSSGLFTGKWENVAFISTPYISLPVALILQPPLRNVMFN